MKISFNTFVNQTLSVLTVCMILPLAAQADQVVVADANGNQLIYSYDGADGPATFTGVKTYAAEEDKAGHIIIADNVTDANSNSHEVKYIGGSTSNRGNIKSIVFGQNIIAVGGPEGTSGDAFYNCQKLESVTLNSKLEILGKWAFQNCNKLENVNLGEATSLKTIMIKAFQNADRIRSLELPESVTLLEESVFEGCDSLRTFTFLGTSQITNIPYNCFVSCISLERITLPDGYVYPAGQNADTTKTDFGSYTLDIRQDGQKLIIKTSFTINKGRFDISRKDDFANFREKTSKMLRRLIIIEKK